jgi:hypothetical protein
MAVRDDRSDVKQTTTGFRDPLKVQSLTSAKSKFLSLSLIPYPYPLSLNPPRQDGGRWWVQGDLLCRQYKNWYSGQKLCGVLKLDGENYLIHGETGELLEIFKRVGDRL